MKSALEERMKCEVLSRHPILAFLVEHAGRLMSRYQVGRDGRTAYELHAGKPYRTTARTRTEEYRKKLESCLAEDEETKLRSEAAKLRVDNWLASRVESTEKPRSGDAVSHEPRGSGEQLGTGGSGKWFSADGRIKQFSR